MGRLCQGVVKGPNGKGKRIEGTNTFFAIKFENIPEDRLNEICYTSVVCEVRPGEKDPKRTRIKSMGQMCAIQGILEQTHLHCNFSNLLLTVSCQ